MTGSPALTATENPASTATESPALTATENRALTTTESPALTATEKPRFDGDRKPRFDSDRKPRFDSDRKPFESDFFEDEVLDVEFNAFPSPEIVENDEQERDLPSIIMGRNPVKEAIKSGRSIDRILVTKEHDGSLGEIIGLARDENLVIREVDRSSWTKSACRSAITANPEIIRASLQKSRVLNMPNSRIYLTMPAFAMKNPLLFFLTALKIRIISAQSSAVRECAGAHGVVITKRRSAPVTATVVKTSAGAAEHMRIARVVNLVSAIETLKKGRPLDCRRGHGGQQYV